jgi:hypothetical protein
MSPVRPYAFRGSQAGRLNHVNSGQRRSNDSLKMTLGSWGTYLKTGRVTV